MAFPRRVRGALESVGTGSIQGHVAYDEVCEGAKFHSPTPLVLHEVEVAGDTAMLCSTCIDNFGVMLHLLRECDGLDWDVRREFGNKLRALVEAHWRHEQGDGDG